MDIRKLKDIQLTMDKTIRLFIIFFAGFLISGCETVLSKNDAEIQQALIEKHLGNGQKLDSYNIVDHIESDGQLTVIIEGMLDSKKKYQDTLQFVLTGDGWIVPNSSK